MIEPKRDVLLLVHRVPFPPDKGDRISTFHILRHLSQRANVHLACLADAPIEAQAWVRLQKLTKRMAIVPLGRLARHVRTLGSLLAGRTSGQRAFSSPDLPALVRPCCGTTRSHPL